MLKFWKRVSAQDGTIDDLSSARDLALGTEDEGVSFDRLSARGDRETPAGFAALTAPSKPGLVFANEEEIRAQAERPEQIDVEALVDRLTNKQARSGRGPVFWLWLAAAPLFGVWLTVSLLNGDLRWAPLCLFALATARAFAVQSGRQQVDRAALLNSDLDNRWLGPLCEALEWPDRRVRGVAARLLTQFLPRLREGDTSLFRDEHRTCLYRRLAPREALSDPELALSILHALPIIGTDAGLPCVERLSTFSPLTRSMRRVRSVARTVLAGLERRIALNRALATSVALHSSQADSRLVPDTTPAGDQLTEAEREALAANNAHVDKVMAEVEAAMRKLRVPGMRMGFLIASWGIMFPYFAVQTILQFANGQWLVAIIAAAAALFTTQLYRLTLTAEHRKAARKLMKVEDVRCIGRLADFLEWPEVSVHNAAASALTRLLNRVKASDRVPLTPKQRGTLHQMLAPSNARQYAEFQKSILMALGQIGDATAVPFVQHLASTTPTSARQREVCEAAQDCLEYLKVRAELNRSSQTLLRASSVNAAPSDMLVRPADARTVTDPAQLLRADSGNPAS